MVKKPRYIRKWTLARRIVQWSILILFLSPIFLVKVEGDNFFFGTLTSSSFLGVTLTDPFAALQVLMATREISFVYFGGALIIFLFYALVRGRVFCSWVCPLNTLLELTGKLRKWVKLPDKQLNRHQKKYFALAFIILSFLIGVPIFEVISPIGYITRNLLFTWGIGVWLIFAIILFELFVSKRGWCRYICPLGGFYQSIGKLGIFQVKFNHDACRGCEMCRSVCFSDPEILEPGIFRESQYVKADDCTLCGACVDNCPFDALKITVKEKPLLINHFHEKHQLRS